jgi:hypothetical protein
MAMQEPDQGGVPDVVPAEWVPSYRAERTERQVLLVNELERLDRASRRDTSFLLAASWLCLLLLAIAFGWVGTNARPAGTWLAPTVVLSAFAPCPWLIHRAQRPGGA